MVKRGDFVILYDINFSWVIILVPSSSFAARWRVCNFRRKKNRGKVCFLCRLFEIHLFHLLTWKDTAEVSFVN